MSEFIGLIIWCGILVGPILLPIGLGVIAYKRKFSLVMRAVFIMIGLLIGLGAFAYATFRPFHPSTSFEISVGSCILGYLSLIIGIFLRKQVGTENTEVTLPMPLPPGTRD